MAFWAVNSPKKEYDIQNIVYIPFQGQERLWKKTGMFGQKDYQKMFALADQVNQCVRNTKSRYDKRKSRD